MHWYDNTPYGYRSERTLTIKNKKSAIQDHIKSCKPCMETKYDKNNFQILRQCSTTYETKVQEALLIKQHNPKLNAQLYGGGLSILHVIVNSCYFIA